jgi:hypothetical protein
VPSKKVKQPLSVTHPDLAKEADGWNPQNFSAGMNNILLWKCSKGHNWKTSIFRRSKGSGCPVCSNRKILKGVNDFATTHPLLASEVIEGDSSAISAGSSQKLKWKCSVGHEWEATVASRVLRSTGCPFCIGTRILSGYNDLKTLFPEIAAQADGWDPTIVSPGAHQAFKWRCDKGHIWSEKIQNRVTHSKRRKIDSDANGCPYCWGRKTWPGFNDLGTTNPEVSRKLLDILEAKDVTSGSDKKLNWKCDLGHSFEARVNEMVKPGSHCPFCSGAKVLIGFNDLQSTHPHFASQLTNLDPKTISAGSKKIGNWRCNLGHFWKSPVNSRISNSVICPTCTGRIILIGFNDLSTTDPLIAAEIVDSNPESLTRGSGKKVTWKCEQGHLWKAKVTDRTSHKSGCPSCAKSGFDPNKKGFFYLLLHQNWNMYQIGITNNPERRLTEHKNRGWETLELRGPMDGHLTQQWETAILRMLKAKGADLSNSKIAGKFDGYSEAWSKATFEAKSIKQLMQLTEEFEESSLKKKSKTRKIEK